MRRPPRAWCLAIRASDQRINPATACCIPEDAAMLPAQLGPGYEPDYGTGKHAVTITAPLLRKICRPFMFTSRTPMDIVARELGISMTTLQQMVRRGMFRVSHIPNYGGRWGRPVPLLYSDQWIDPCNGRGREYAEKWWGTMWRYLSDHVPDDLEQTLVRVPHWIEYKTLRRRGKIDYMGWHWLCPGCGKTRRVLYWPIGPTYGLRQLLGQRAACEIDAAHPDARSAPMGTFACGVCHGVMFHTCDVQANWNRLISHLSDGLMYGRDVPRPAWFSVRRKVNWHPILNRAPSKRRAMILEDILAGLSYRQIMRKQGIALSTVSTQAAILYKQHRVKGPAALRELLGGKAGKSEIRMSNLETNSNDRSAENGESARRAGARKAA